MEFLKGTILLILGFVALIVIFNYMSRNDPPKHERPMTSLEREMRDREREDGYSNAESRFRGN